MGKVNKLTPGSNLFWESSRMMLPEHKLEIVQHRESLKKREKPQLDSQAIEDIMYKISESQEYKSEITVTLFDEYEDEQITGYVVRVDERRGKILLQAAAGDEWIEFKRILKVDNYQFR
ncbi:YolD-like family protein [Paenibacillus sp. GCM10027626]|uniref:YolD-like family protein n=1 Tax=Paenibacillus sp. GCM10027626 TaxID=3273411 RepID=UPI00362E1C86